MRRKRRWKEAEQLMLFDPPPTRPRWQQFPLEVKEEAIRLLMQALRDHLARCMRRRRKGGTADE